MACRKPLLGTVFVIIFIVAEACQVEFVVIHPFAVNRLFMGKLEHHLQSVVPKDSNLVPVLKDWYSNDTIRRKDCAFLAETLGPQLAGKYHGNTAPANTTIVPLMCEVAAVEVENSAAELKVAVISSTWRAHRGLPGLGFPRVFDLGYTADAVWTCVTFLRTFDFVDLVIVCNQLEEDVYLKQVCIHLLAETRKSSNVLRYLVENTTDSNSTGAVSCTDALVSAKYMARVVLFVLPVADLITCLRSASALGLNDGSFVFVEITPPGNSTFPSLSSPDSDQAPPDGNIYAQLFVIAANRNLSNDLSEFSKKPATKAALGVMLPQEIWIAFVMRRIVDKLGKVLTSSKAASRALLEFCSDTSSIRYESFRILQKEVEAASRPIKELVQVQRVTLQGLPVVFAELDPLSPGSGMNFVMDNDTFAQSWTFSSPFPPPNEPPCGFRHEAEACQAPDYTIMSIVAIPIIIPIVFGIIMASKRRKDESESAKDKTTTAQSQYDSIDPTKWLIEQEDLKQVRELQAGKVSRALSRISMASSGHFSTALVTLIAPEVHNYSGRKVWVKTRELSYYFIPEGEELIYIQKARNLTHASITRWIGVVVSQDPMVYELKIVMEYCSRGSLQDLITIENLDFTFQLKAIMIRDIVTAMTFVHGSFIGCHGSLKSPNCLISDRFTIKITDYGLNVLPVHPPAVEADEYLYRGLLWTAPEILRGPIIRVRKGSKEGDVYSFAIILQEVLTQTEPFYDFVTGTSLLPKGKKHENDKEQKKQKTDHSVLYSQDVVHKIIQKSSTPYRPPVPKSACSDAMHNIMRQSWSENPTERPTFKALGNMLDNTPGFTQKTTYLDFLLEKMEEYSNQLEDRVRHATSDFLEEKKKSEEILAQMLPRAILEKIKRGIMVDPESFDHVTLGITAIIDFAGIASKSTPPQIVVFLNELFVLFDAVIERFDVYKVETIQDSYVVASGLPDRNGRAHATEVSGMGLEMLKAVQAISLKHDKEHFVEMKVGIHTGIIAAGVIGLKAPRYCLFGDTINTASRMCSTGSAQQVHISEFTKVFLDEYEAGRFELIDRGEMEVKGKGLMRTYFLRRLAL